MTAARSAATRDAGATDTSNRSPAGFGMGIERVKFEDIKKLKGRTSRKELDRLTDAQIKEAVLGDRDSAMPTEKELKEFERPKKRG